jgi:hypothetical protein
MFRICGTTGVHSYQQLNEPADAECADWWRPWPPRKSCGVRGHPWLWIRDIGILVRTAKLDGRDAMLNDGTFCPGRFFGPHLLAGSIYIPVMAA